MKQRQENKIEKINKTNSWFSEKKVKLGNNKTINKIAISAYLSIIDLNVNGPNAPNKRYIFFPLQIIHIHCYLSFV